MVLFGNFALTLCKKGNSSRWLSGSKGSPPSTVNPLINDGDNNSIMCLCVSWVNGSP